MSFRTKLFTYLCQRDRGWIISLLVAVFIVYLPFLGNPFIFDDFPFFKSDVVSLYATSMFHFDLRWLPYASLGWTYAIFSDVNTYFFHLGNVLIHVGNVILLFYLLRQLVGAVISERDKPNLAIWGAWLAALLFACHPVAVYATGYIIERSILLATFFALVMQLAYVRALLTGDKRWLILAVIGYFMAGFSKEHSVLMPAVLAAQHILLRRKSHLSLQKADRSALLLCWGAFLAIGLLLVLRAKGVLGAPYEPTATIMFAQQGLVASTPMLHLLSALTQAGLFFKYLLLWLLPNPAWMSVDMREHFISSLGEWQGWAGGLAFIAYGVLAFRLLLSGGGKGLVGLALLYPWLQFPVEMAGIRVQEPFVLYRSYLWMPGMMLVFPLLLLRFPGRRTALALSLGVLLLLPLAWNRLWVFGDNYRLWNDAVLLLPSEQVAGADRILYNRAYAAAGMGRWTDAVIDYEKVVALQPLVAVVQHDLGVAYANLNRYQEAIAQFDTAINLDPEYAKAYFDKGMAQKRLHQDELAMLQMKKSCELKYAMACLIVKMEPQKK
jgi:tetratricopeptide (TPR) repeat protein